MIALLRNVIGFAPILAVLVGMGGGGWLSGLAVWKLKDFWFTTISEPAVRRDQQALDAIEFQKLADDAKRKRELEIFKFIERLTQEYIDQKAEDDAWDKARVDLLEREIEDWKNGLGESDRRSGLTERELDFVVGVPDPVRARPEHGQGAGANRRP